MPKFAVVITETLVKDVIVKAEDENEAFYKVLDNWRDGKETLDSDNFSHVEFETIPCDKKGNYDVCNTINRYDENGNTFPPMYALYEISGIMQKWLFNNK